MRFCPHCGEGVDLSDRFCSSCGTSLRRAGASVGEAASASNTARGTRDLGAGGATRARRLGQVVGNYRRASLAVAALAVVAMIGLVVMLLTRGSEPSCYSVAMEYGDLARRVEYGRIDEVRNQVDVEVERDDYRRAAQLAINFVANSKVLGGETYPSRTELEGFVRSSAC